MADLINKTDSFNTGRGKLNEAIQDSETALNTANNADQKADQALSNSESTQDQLDNVIIESGTSDAETIQARTDADGTTHDILKDRLDNDFSKSAKKDEVLSGQNTRKAITSSSTQLKNLLVDERFDEQTLGTVPTGWIEVGGTAKITDQDIIHGKHALLLQDTVADTSDSAYLSFNDITENCDMFIALKPMMSETSTIHLSDGARDGANNAVSLRINSSYGLEFYDGSTSSWVGTGIGAQGEVIGVKIKNINFSTFTYDIDVNNGAFTQASIGFQSNRSKINRLTFYLQNTSNQIITDFISIKKTGGKKGYVFGDSVTRGTGYGDLSSDGSDAFINQYMTTYNPQTTWTRNTDGGGQTGITKWALAELESRITGMDYVIFAFGLHSVKMFDDYGLPTLDTFLYQYRQLIRNAKSLGVEPIGWVMPRRGDVDYNTQLEWAKAQEQVCIDEGVLCIQAWDSLDLTPFNDEYEDQDLSYYHTDLIHPITAGHTQISEAVYKAIGTL